MLMIFQRRKLCPFCGKPMKLVPSASGRGREEFRCPKCDEFDPLKSSAAKGWTNSPLKPPE
jgi:tRNA(Ile2) C34 agmatinyltransferase TiaS